MDFQPGYRLKKGKNVINGILSLVRASRISIDAYASLVNHQEKATREDQLSSQKSQRIWRAPN